MIDMHSHILPGIDDGAKNIEESINMLKEAKQAGFTDIISTSHFIEENYNTSKEVREIIINKIKQEIHDIDINIYNGCEAYVSENMQELIKSDILPTINNSRYLLFELPMNNEIIILDKIIYNLKQIGIVPIIAHPERYSYVQDNPNMLIDLIENGVLFQVNYASVIGKYGSKAKKTAEKLLKNNMAHFLGTDTHRQNSIYTEMNKILKRLNKIVTKEKLEELTTLNPQKVLNNETINIEEPKRIKKFF